MSEIKKKRTAQIQDALDTTLSGLQDDFGLSRKIIQMSEKPLKPRIKFSYGIVFAILLALFAATAVAAVYLSSQQFVQQKVLPIAKENDANGYEEKFSNHELAKIIQMAQDNEIELSDDIITAFENGYGYYEQSVIMDIVRREFGEDYSLWSIEQKYWFGETMVLLGFSTYNSCYLPSNDEPSLQDCIAIIQKNILESYNDDITDSSIWKQRVSFEELTENSMSHNNPHWYFSFNSLDLQHNSYEVELTAQGQIVSINPTFVPSDDSTGNDIVDQYQQIYGSYGNWSVETWASLGKELKGRWPGKERAWFFMCAGYILPPENSITQTEAEHLAFEAVGDEYTKIDSVVCCVDRGSPSCKIELKTLYPQDIGSGKYSHIWLVEMDCISGEINDIQEYTTGSGISPFIQWVPRSIIENPIPMPEEENG